MAQLIELDSQQVLPPQAFRPTAEAEVFPVVRDVAGRLADRIGGDVLLSEFAGPYGRVDFLLAVHEPAGLVERRAAALRPLSTRTEASVVASLSARYARTVEEVSERSGAATNTVHRVGRDLARSGHIVLSADGRLRRHAALRPVIKTVALEAKLDDWRSALAQARTYALWTTWSMVVMDHLSNRSALVAEARRLGIGVAHDGEVLVRPRIQPNVPHLQLLASETYLEASGLLRAED